MSVALLRLVSFFCCSSSTVVFAILLTVTNTSTVTAASPRRGHDGTLGHEESHVAGC
jgi:hypothetical protein